MADDEKPRPRKKTKELRVRVDPELLERAKDRAKKEGRPLSEIVRAWLRLFAGEEVGPPVDEYIDREKKRAPGAGRKPRKKKKPTQ